MYELWIFNNGLSLFRTENQPRVGSTSGSGSDGDGYEGVWDSGLFQAIQPYTPTAPGELALLQDDTVKLLKFGPQGWAKVFNTRAHDSGYVPGKFYFFTVCSV